ncbi:MAG TPA: hypothetical protein PKY46_12435 [Ignavibacteriaceae bacterium]|nr:hypothetical protein [Ignavibacteriaceae bacterium]
MTAKRMTAKRMTAKPNDSTAGGSLFTDYCLPFTPLANGQSKAL